MLKQTEMINKWKMYPEHNDGGEVSPDILWDAASQRDNHSEVWNVKKRLKPKSC